MVRDNLGKAVAQNEKHNHAPDEPARTPQVHGPESQEQQNQAEGTPDGLQWSRLSWEELEAGCQAETGVNTAILPSHLRPFHSQEEYRLVRQTRLQLLHSSYYWGPLPMAEAHETLAHSSPGTFLIRDSGQPDVFFTLSYQSAVGPVSVRVMLDKLLFSLYGCQRTFPSLFALLAYYTKLTRPHRKQRPELLKQACRRALVRAYGADNLRTLPGLSMEVKDYVLDYPHAI
ncbi:suppressor of cytokine signaling 1-like [Nerophis lumbriciformis]|uniref:suppressor of cytokine signaling 1-like n=1 Tax=Nerophis lumbriciformis TaxID=546530 RepID=UPI003BA8FDDC